MAEENDNPDTLTPPQRQYAEIAKQFADRFIEAGKEVSDEVAESIKESIEWGMSKAWDARKKAAAFISGDSGKTPATSASPAAQGSAQGQQDDSRDAPNAGWLHIEPRLKKGQVSLAGKAAIGLSDFQQRAMAYGIQTPEWLNNVTSAAKIASAAMGDTHIYGRKLRQRVESMTEAGPMPGPATASPTSMGQMPMGVPFGGHDSIPEIQMTGGMTEMAGPGFMTGTAGRPSGGDGDRGTDALLSAIVKLTEKIEKLTESADQGGEDETTENAKTSLWMDTPSDGGGGRGGVTPTFSGASAPTPTRPHQPAAQSSDWASTIISIVTRFL